MVASGSVSVQVLPVGISSRTDGRVSPPARPAAGDRLARLGTHANSMTYGARGSTIPSGLPSTRLVTSNVPNSRSVGLVTLDRGRRRSGESTVTGAPTIGGSQTYDVSPSTGPPPKPGWSSVTVHTDSTRTPLRSAGVAVVADHVVSIGSSVPYRQLIVPVNSRSSGTRSAAGPMTTLLIVTSE